MDEISKRELGKKRLLALYDYMSNDFDWENFNMEFYETCAIGQLPKIDSDWKFNGDKLLYKDKSINEFGDSEDEYFHITCNESQAVFYYQMGKHVGHRGYKEMTDPTDVPQFLNNLNCLISKKHLELKSLKKNK